MISVTLFADGSWDGPTKAGGWGAWAKMDGTGSKTWAGSLPNCADHNLAELSACVLGLGSLLDHTDRQGINRRDLSVLVQSDSDHTIRFILSLPGVQQSKHPEGMLVQPSFKVAITKDSRVLLDQLNTMHQSIGRLIVRHVKGHKAHKGGRWWVNDLCDKLAKDQMRKLRAGILGVPHYSDGQWYNRPTDPPPNDAAAPVVPVDERPLGRRPYGKRVGKSRVGYLPAWARS